jgi:hypothetical protein
VGLPEADKVGVCCVNEQWLLDSKLKRVTSFTFVLAEPDGRPGLHFGWVMSKSVARNQRRGYTLTQKPAEAKVKLRTVSESLIGHTDHVDQIPPPDQCIAGNSESRATDSRQYGT